VSGRTFTFALLFAFSSGLYWWFVGQLLPFVVPMMLDDSGMLFRSLLLTIGALTAYIIVAMGFFVWLVRQKRN
jgi:hypothetical protein